ncbi:MAG: Gfo/Idh/MocA family protein [Tepidisphaeraceae bacterium]
MTKTIDLSPFLPSRLPGPVCRQGEFIFAAAYLDHGHIVSMCQELVKAGGTLRYIHGTDQTHIRNMKAFAPEARVVERFEQVLDDREVRLVASAGVPNERGPIGVRVMRAGKDYFVDKTPFTTLAQLDEARRVVKETGRIFAVYYGERLQSESGMLAGSLIERGLIGRVVQVMGLGPHRLNALARADWFFDKPRYGGILTDIGSHQCEQFLAYTGATDATIGFARAGNFNNPAYPGLEDFGEASLVGDNGTSGYFRVDWFTPDGLRTWGDGRTLVLGTDGYIELRKYVDVATDNDADQLILVNKEGEGRLACQGKIGFPYFGQLIRDSLDRTETAMKQSHTFKAAELCLKAQALADSRRL